MYTVKVTGPGTITFKGRAVRVPAVFNKVSERDLKILKVMCKAHNFEYEILEAESERLARVAEKVKADSGDVADVDAVIEGTETKVEDLFESDDTLGDLLNMGKE